MAQQHTETLLGIEIFQQANPLSIQLLASCAQIKHYRKGQWVYCDKSLVPFIYIVLEGFVSLYKINAQGEKKVVFVLGKGQMINETVLPEVTASIQCEAFENTKLLLLPKENLLSAMEKDFNLTKAILKTMGNKTRRLYRQMKNTAGALRGNKRIAAKLWKLAKDFGANSDRGVKIDIDMSITYLADMLGMKRESVSRQLKILQDNGLVFVNQNHFYVPDLDSLANYFKHCD